MGIVRSINKYFDVQLVQRNALLAPESLAKCSLLHDCTLLLYGKQKLQAILPDRRHVPCMAEKAVKAEKNRA